MKAFLLFLLLLTCLSCETDYTKAEATDFLNENAKTIVRINSLKNLKSNLSNSHFLNQLDKTDAYKTINSHFSIFEKVQTKHPIYINLFSAEEFSFATTFTNSLIKVLDPKLIKRDSVIIDAIAAQKITFNKKELYVTLRDSVIIGANTKAGLQTIYNQQKNETLLKFFKTTNSSSEIAIISNQKQAFSSPIYIDPLLNKKAFTNHLVFDVDLSQDQILLNGITKATDSTKSFINIFVNTRPNENELALITPNNSDGFLSITYDDFEIFKENLNAFNKKATTKEDITLLQNITEVGIIYSDTNSYVLNSIDTHATKTALQEETTILENYRSIPIYTYRKPQNLQNHFYPFIHGTTKLYCQLDQFFVFSNSKDALQNIIANYQNKTTLFFKDYYKQNIKHLSSQSSLLQVVNNNALSKMINVGLKNTSKLNLSQYHSSAIQFSYDYDFAHFNAVLSKSKVIKKQKTISEKFNIKLDHAILNEPLFVKNHVSSKNEIIVQDVKNTLYLISNSGRILWKKALKNEILGKIEQIDILKNGKLQYAFATKKAVYVLDRNGNTVKPFPVQLKDNITQPLSVFDYDKNKNYRLLITQGKELLMLDAKGKTVTGFKANKGNTITSQPKHFRIGTKDYIVFGANKDLKILNRTGKRRVKVNQAINLKGSTIFLRDKKFTVYTNNGKLIQIDQKGKVTTTNIASKKVTKFNALNKTFTYLLENKLTIKNKTIELDFGNYTSPKLFYSNNKVFVAITDLQTQKVYVFDSNAKPIEHFPVFGTSGIDLRNTNKLEIITKGDSNSLILYTAN